MKTDLAHGVLTITMNRPSRMNALTENELSALVEAVDLGSRDPEVRVIVLGAEGAVFCAGADLGTADDMATATVGTATIDAANALVEAMTAAPKPVVTLVRGAAAGVGVPIALAGDLVICDHSAYFMLAFTRIGLMPDGGSSALVAASVGRSRAMRMALLAERLSAADALVAGLVTHVEEASAFERVAADVVKRLADGPQVALRLTKHAVNEATLTALPDAFAREREGQLGLLLASDFSEGARAFREKRSAQFSDR